VSWEPWGYRELAEVKRVGIDDVITAVVDAS